MRKLVKRYENIAELAGRIDIDINFNLCELFKTVIYKIHLLSLFKRIQRCTVSRSVTFSDCAEFANWIAIFKIVKTGWYVTS